MKTRRNHALPRAPRSIFKRLGYYASSLADHWRTRRGLVPPKNLDFVGGANFEGVGLEFKQHFIHLCDLQPDDRVLDVGCGIGRMAIPLTTYLTAGEYFGIDIAKVGIDWCNQRIAPRFVNFHFLLSDVRNDFYNPGGQVAAHDYRFPFTNQFFDFVFLTSVFTHMFPADLQNYLGEIARVLKPGANCLITFFILNDESRALMRAGRANPDFRFPLDGCWTAHQRHPEGALAYEEFWLRRLFAEHGLTIDEPIRYGSWCGRAAHTSCQDMIIATKQ